MSFVIESNMSKTEHSQNTLYHLVNDIKSHVLRMAIAYKHVQVEYLPLKQSLPEHVLHLNPYGTLPMWADRDVIVHDFRNLLEYLEERYPAPSLLPAVPAERATIRNICTRIEREWVTRIKQLGMRDIAEQRPIIQALTEDLVAAVPEFEEFPFYHSHTLTYADCYMAAILWRLPALGVHLPKEALPVAKYAQRVFKMLCFAQSLTAQERAMHQPTRSEI